MNHVELKRLAERIGNAAQEAAEQAATVVDDIESVEQYPTPDEWIETVEGSAEELVATLDLLADAARVARDEIDAALRGQVSA